MRLGFYTNYTPQIAEFAHATGFNSLELSAWPHSTLNPNKLQKASKLAMLRDLEQRDIQVSALGYYPNPLDPDRNRADEVTEYLLQVVDLAADLGVGVVATFAGRDPNLSVEANLPLYKERFSPIAEHAERKKIKIAFENCPMMNRFNMHGENIAFSPEIWRVLFDIVPSDNIGLELDPSHCVWQGIDYVKAVRDFGHKIFHVHAKDMEIRRDVLAESGIYGTSLRKVQGLGHGWWRARAPGWGEVDWAKFISALIEVGYKGNIDIEHEDDVFAEATKTASEISEEEIVASYGTERKGLVLGYKTLSKFVPSVS